MQLHTISIVIYFKDQIMLKYSSFLFIVFSIIFCSCNKNDDPELEVNLPITETFLPVSVDFNVNDIDTEQKRQLTHLVNNEHIVNDISEIPEDPLGLNETHGSSFSKINFKEYTLLIKYVLHDWSIDTYNNRFYRNTKEGTYNWTVNVGTVSISDDSSDDLRFSRFAILVKKLPADAKITSWFGLTYLGWYPSSDT